MNFKTGKWAAQIIDLQHGDGSWGYFHTLSMPTKKQPITTEQALRRLRVLGFTSEDQPVRRALVYIDKCLSGEISIPDYNEVKPDWPLFLRTMFAANMKLFSPGHEAASAIASEWAGVIEKAFSSGVFNQEKYDEAYGAVLRPKSKKIDYFKSFVNFYPIALLPGLLPPETERLMLEHVLNYPGGIYYVGYNRPLTALPPVFASLETSRCIASFELLSNFATSREKLSFAVDWLNANKDERGQWDLGPKAKDGIYFPLSDSWRDAGDRKADCTRRIGALLNKLVS